MEINKQRPNPVGLPLIPSVFPRHNYLFPKKSTFLQFSRLKTGIGQLFYTHTTLGKMKTIPALIASASIAIAGIPPELEFLKSLLPDSRHVSTQVASGKFSGSVLSIYEGNDSVETVVAALKQKLGIKPIPEESNRDLAEIARIFGEAGLGEPTAYKEYAIDQLRFSILTFELRAEETIIKKILILTEPK